jgi:hypothetical protein
MFDVLRFWLLLTLHSAIVSASHVGFVAVEMLCCKVNEDD